MRIPDFQTLMLPVLRLADAGEIKVAEAVGRIAGEFVLTDHEREKLLPSGGQAKIANRVHWSATCVVTSDPGRSRGEWPRRRLPIPARPRRAAPAVKETAT